MTHDSVDFRSVLLVVSRSDRPEVGLKKGEDVSSSNVRYVRLG